MYRSDDEINVFNDYDHKIYAPTFMNTGLDYEFIPKVEGEPQFVPVKWADLVRLKNSEAFTRKRLRFEPEKETDIVKDLRLMYDKECYDLDQIRHMIINANDNVIKEILGIRDKDVIKEFKAQLVYLRNTNQYHIDTKLETYIRAREEELENGLRESELEGQSSLNDNENVKKETIETEKKAELKAEEEVEEKEEKPKKPTRNTKAKEDK